MKSQEKVLVFRLDNQEYGMDIELVTAAMNGIEVENIPCDIPNVIGFTMVHGIYTAVYSLKKRFNVGVEKAKTDAILADCGKIKILMPVDGVNKIYEVTGNELQGIPTILHNPNNGYLNGVAHVDGKLLNLVNPDDLLSQDDLEKLYKILDGLKAKDEEKTKSATDDEKSLAESNSEAESENEEVESDEN